MTVMNAPSRLAHGGKTVYGARVGVLMVETRFPRIPGDFGNLRTWPFPVLVRVVRGITPARVTTFSARELIEPCLAAADELVADGADGITTSCGFLSLVQDELAARCKVPVAASSLMQVPFIERLLPPGERAGVITVSAEHLGPAHLAAAGAPADTPLIGCEQGREFFRAFAGDATELDAAAAEGDILDAGEELLRRHPEVGAVVLECTNMLPFSRALRDRIGIPVYDAYTFVCWFHAGIAPRDFGHPGSAPRPWRER